MDSSPHYLPPGGNNNLPSIPPSTITFTPVTCPLRTGLLTTATCLATSAGKATFLKGVLANMFAGQMFGGACRTEFPLPGRIEEMGRDGSHFVSHSEWDTRLAAGRRKQEERKKEERKLEERKQEEQKQAEQKQAEQQAAEAQRKAAEEAARKREEEEKEQAAQKAAEEEARKKVEAETFRFSSLLRR